MPEPSPNPAIFQVLIVDDNRAIHQDFEKILAPRQNGPSPLKDLETSLFGKTPQPEPGMRLKIESAYQGQEALAMVQSALSQGRPYALAFVDVLMPPGWDGVETAIRLLEADPELQIVLCTAYSDYDLDRAIPRLKADGRLLILKKPFESVEVVRLAMALTAKWALNRAVRQGKGDLEAPGKA